MTVTDPSTHPVAAPARFNPKWMVLFVWVLLILGVMWTDERFLVDSKDEEWPHIAPFKWWLLVHGLAGFAALLIGPLQFSERLRRTRTKLHRVLGRVYIGAICVAAPMALYIGKWEPTALSNSEDWAQAGGWLLCAVLALVFAVKRNIPRHRQWVARSYGFTFVFIMARAPHLWGWHWKSEEALVTYRWFLVFGALIVPDLILQWDELFKRRKLRAVT